MKPFTFYKVDYRHNGESRGFSYHFNRKEARQHVRKAVLNGTAEPLEDGGSDIEAITIEPTKRGIWAALGRHAIHPDNG